jgi:hypothetical protein
MSFVGSAKYRQVDYQSMLYRWQALFESVAVDPAIAEDPAFVALMAAYDRDFARLERIDPVGHSLLKARIAVQTGDTGPNVERMP